MSTPDPTTVEWVPLATSGGPVGPAGPSGPAGPAGPAGSLFDHGGMILGTYKFSNTITNTPAVGEFRFDNADQKLATKFWANITAFDGEDWSNALSAPRPRIDRLVIQLKDDPTIWNLYDIIDLEFPSSSVYGLLVRWLDGKYSIPNTKECIVSIVRPIPFPRVGVTAFPSSPVDGQEVDLLMPGETTPRWRMRYDAALSGAYKWIFMGGPPYQNGTSGAPNARTAVATYTELIPGGLRFTAPYAGTWECGISGQVWKSVADPHVEIALGVGTTPSIVAASSVYAANAYSTPCAISAMLLSVGNQVNVLYWQSIAGTLSVDELIFWFRPIRLG